MRKVTMLGAGALALSLLAGCGGGGSADKVTRVLVGYVYVTKNSGGTYTGPTTAFILPANNLNVIDPTPANPESGDEIPVAKPTAGTLTLSVDGSLTRALDTETFNLASSNEIICTAKGKVNGLVTVSASGIELDSVAKTFASLSVNLGTTASNGTNLGIQSANTPTYTPGAPDDIRIRMRTTKGVGGTAVNGTWKSPDDMMVSNGTGLGTGFMAGQVYDLAAAVLDANGIVITGASVTVTPSDLTRVTYGSNQLTTALGQTTADVEVTVAVTGATLINKLFHGDYNQGTAAAITVTPAGPTDLLWAASGAEATQAMTVTAKNEVGANVVGSTVNLTSNKSSANDWQTGAFDSTTAVFTPATGVTDASGQLATVVTAPTSTGALPAGNAAKGLCTVTATIGANTGTATLRVVRPLGDVQITGPTMLDTGSATPNPAQLPVPANIVKVTSMTDIDTDTLAPADYPAVTWNRVNTVAGANVVGNTGDTSPRSVSNATIASNGVVTAGTIAGQVVVTATAGGVTSAVPLTIEIYGKPSKLVYNPDTNATGGYTGTAGNTQAFTVAYYDAFGHNLTSEVSGLRTQSGISSSAAGTISAGGLGVSSFDLTFGTGTGTFTIALTTATWTGTHSPNATTGVYGNSAAVDFSGLFRSGSVN